MNLVHQRIVSSDVGVALLQLLHALFHHFCGAIQASEVHRGICGNGVCCQPRAVAVVEEAVAGFHRLVLVRLIFRRHGQCVDSRLHIIGVTGSECHGAECSNQQLQTIAFFSHILSLCCMLYICCKGTHFFGYNQKDAVFFLCFRVIICFSLSLLPAICL